MTITTQASHKPIKLFYVGQEEEVYGLETRQGKLIKGFMDDTTKFHAHEGVFLHVYRAEWVKLKNFVPIYPVPNYEGFAMRKIVEIAEFRIFSVRLQFRNIRKK